MVFEELTAEVIESFESNIKNKLIQGSGVYDLKDLAKVVYQNKLPNMSLETCQKISKTLYDKMYGLGILQSYLDDAEINEVMVNGLSPIIIEKNGHLVFTDRLFQTYEEINIVIQRIVSEVNRRVNASNPIVDARLKDGSRVNIVLAPVAVNGPIITIRKFKKNFFDLDLYETLKIISPEAREVLEYLVVNKYNIFVSGGTSSGKTTFLNALARVIPANERIITIEDAAELNLSCIKNLVSLETKSDNADGKGGIAMSQLIRSALRMRPDRIVVGEVRGPEALEMLHAMNTGHDGSLSTGHANSSKDMLSRLELMVLSGIEIPLVAVQRMIASSIDILIHLERGPQGKRYVKEIYQVFYEEGYQLRALFLRANSKLVKKHDLVKKKL